MNKPKFKVGDIVGFSRAYLEYAGPINPEYWLRRGVVREVSWRDQWTECQEGFYYEVVWFEAFGAFAALEENLELWVEYKRREREQGLYDALGQKIQNLDKQIEKLLAERGECLSKKKELWKARARGPEQEQP